MTEFDHDIRLRKQMASGARHRKCGSKSLKCSLPSDNMTNKQWKERNGTVAVIKMNEPIEWGTFTKISKDLQEEYVRNLKDTYNATATDISAMMGITRGSLSKYIKNNNLDIAFSVGHSMNKEQRREWNNFLNKSNDCNVAKICGADEASNEEPVCVEEIAAEPVKPVEMRPGRMIMPVFALTFDGVVDANMIANSIRQLASDDTEYTIEIRCVRKDSKNFNVEYPSTI